MISRVDAASTNGLRDAKGPLLLLSCEGKRIGRYIQGFRSINVRFFCTTHQLQVGVEVLGWVGVGFNTAAFIRSLWHHSTSSSVGSVLGILLFVGLIVARRIDNHRWYLPFLVLNVRCLSEHVKCAVVA